ncbi:hypothetical protein HDU98_012285 [Podochytrium sp. JEL0797]|nr:hypothetical protein HDU98_012285 [Podochytrium sp. JEL0797]
MSDDPADDYSALTKDWLIKHAPLFTASQLRAAALEHLAPIRALRLEKVEQLPGRAAPTEEDEEPLPKQRKRRTAKERKRDEDDELFWRRVAADHPVPAVPVSHAPKASPKPSPQRRKQPTPKASPQAKKQPALKESPAKQIQLPRPKPPPPLSDNHAETESDTESDSSVDLLKPSPTKHRKKDSTSSLASTFVARHTKMQKPNPPPLNPPNHKDPLNPPNHKDPLNPPNHGDPRDSIILSSETDRVPPTPAAKRIITKTPEDRPTSPKDRPLQKKPFDAAAFLDSLF